MRRLALLPLLFLSGCFAPKADFAASRTETQDDSSCQAAKGESAYLRCREKLLGDQQPASAQGRTAAGPDDLLCGVGLGAPRTAAAAGC